MRGSIDGWYKARALARLSDETQRCASIIDIEVGEVTVPDFKARWGSCYP